MAYPKGNEYYLLRSKDGRNKKFETPTDLMHACNAYFKWCLDNPLKEQQIVKYRDHHELIDLDKMRPFTLHGLCNYIDLSLDGFKLYGNRNDFVGVTTRIRQIIYNQKFEGAAAGFLNPNIIARDLGLVDKKDIDQNNKHDFSKPLTSDKIKEIKEALNDAV